MKKNPILVSALFVGTIAINNEFATNNDFNGKRSFYCDKDENNTKRHHQNVIHNEVFYSSGELLNFIDNAQDKNEALNLITPNSLKMECEDLFSTIDYIYEDNVDDSSLFDNKIHDSLKNAFNSIYIKLSERNDIKPLDLSNNTLPLLYLVKTLGLKPLKLITSIKKFKKSVEDDDYMFFLLDKLILSNINSEKDKSLKLHSSKLQKIISNKIYNERGSYTFFDNTGSPDGLLDFFNLFGLDRTLSYLERGLLTFAPRELCMALDVLKQNFIDKNISVDIAIKIQRFIYKKLFTIRNNDDCSFDLSSFEGIINGLSLQDAMVIITEKNIATSAEQNTPSEILFPLAKLISNKLNTEPDLDKTTLIKTNELLAFIDGELFYNDDGFIPFYDMDEDINYAVERIGFEGLLDIFLANRFCSRYNKRYLTIFDIFIKEYLDTNTLSEKVQKKAEYAIQKTQEYLYYIQHNFKDAYNRRILEDFILTLQSDNLTKLYIERRQLLDDQRFSSQTFKIINKFFPNPVGLLDNHIKEIKNTKK